MDPRNYFVSLFMALLLLGAVRIFLKSPLAIVIGILGAMALYYGVFGWKARYLR